MMALVFYKKWKVGPFTVSLSRRGLRVSFSLWNRK